jgi:SAM-dependent methyltransferase
MLPKPSPLSGDYGAWFQDPLIVAAYHHRPPYPQQAIALLVSLATHGTAGPRAVLDVGCGTGDLARRLAPHFDRVDAVDFSRGMLEKGTRLPGGDHSNLRWIHAAVEEAPLCPPYALVTAGESLHWMAWDVVLPRFAAALTPDGMLAIANRDWDGPPAVRERLRPLFARYSPVRDYRPYNLIAELEQRGLFAPAGEQRCGPAPWQPTVEEYLECRHSQRGFSRTHMGLADAAAFDAAIRDALEALCRQGAIARRDGRLQLAVEATVVWGKPLAPTDGPTAVMLAGPGAL